MTLHGRTGFDVRHIVIRARNYLLPLIHQLQVLCVLVPKSGQRVLSERQTQRFRLSLGYALFLDNVNHDINRLFGIARLVVVCLAEETENHVVGVFVDVDAPRHGFEVVGAQQFSAEMADLEQVRPDTEGFRFQLEGLGNTYKTVSSDIELPSSLHIPSRANLLAQ
jgi:hypothetical protein